MAIQYYSQCVMLIDSNHWLVRETCSTLEHWKYRNYMLLSSLLFAQVWFQQSTLLIATPRYLTHGKIFLVYNRFYVSCEYLKTMQTMETSCDQSSHIKSSNQWWPISNNVCPDYSTSCDVINLSYSSFNAMLYKKFHHWLLLRHTRHQKSQFVLLLSSGFYFYVFDTVCK